MKKLIVVFLAGILIFSLTACGSSEEKKKNNEPSQKQEEIDTTIVVEETTQEQTTEEQTKEETTKEEKKIEQPANVSNCASAEDAAASVSDGLMNDDISQIYQTVPESYTKSKKMKTFKNEMSDMLSSLEEMKEVGVVYSISSIETQEPEAASVQSINNDFKSMGIQYRVTEVKDVSITISLKMDGSKQTQEIICLTGKIGDYWYLLGSDE